MALSKNRVWTYSLVKLGRNHTSVSACCHTNQIAQVKEIALCVITNSQLSNFLAAKQTLQEADNVINWPRDETNQHVTIQVVAGIGEVRTQSGMHSPSRFEASLTNSRRKSPHMSYGTKYLPPTAFGKLHESFYTTVSPANLLLLR